MCNVFYVIYNVYYLFSLFVFCLDIVGITRVGSDGIPSSGSFQIEAIRYFMAVSMMMMFVLVA